MAVRRITAERNTRNPRVAAYVRVSTDNMDQDESYEAQQSYYEGKIKGTEGWDLLGFMVTGSQGHMQRIGRSSTR